MEATTLEENINSKITTITTTTTTTDTATVAGTIAATATTAIASHLPVRQCFGDLLLKDKNIPTAKKYLLCNKQILGINRKHLTLFPFNRTVEEFGLLQKYSLQALGIMSKRHGMPQYSALPKEIQLLKKEQLINQRTTRVVLIDKESIEKLLEGLLSTGTSSSSPGTSSSSHGMSSSSPINLDHQEEEIDTFLPPVLLPGRRKTVFTETLQQQTKQEMDNLQTFYVIDFNSKREGQPLAPATLKKMIYHITCKKWKINLC